MQVSLNMDKVEGIMTASHPWIYSVVAWDKADVGKLWKH